MPRPLPQRAPREDFPTPPPAAAANPALALPGQGRRPMRPGTPVKMISPRQLTAGELRDLEKAGIKWQPGDALPVNMAQILAEARQATDLSNAPPPIDPATPPLEVTVRSAEDMPPEAKAQVLQELEAARQEFARPREPAGQYSASVQQALHRVQPRGDLQIPIEPEDESSTPVTQTQASSSAPGDAGTQTRTHCPNCYCRLDQPDMPPPDQFDQDLYVQAWLGEKSFQKTYPLLGGQVQVTFRTLTPLEIDLIFRQVSREMKRGDIVSDFDELERRDRLRFYCQLQRLTSAKFDYDLPDGLTKDTNPYATAWVDDQRPGLTLDDDDTVIVTKLEPHIHEVIRTENMHRVLRAQNALFNRLVGHLDALAGNQDFFRPTAAPV